MQGPFRCCFGGGRWASDSAKLGSRLLLIGVSRGAFVLLFADDGLLGLRFGGGAMVPRRGRSRDSLLGKLCPGAGQSFTGRLWALFSVASATALALEGAKGMPAAQGLLSWEAGVLGVEASSGSSDIAGVEGVVRPGGRGRIETVPGHIAWVAFGRGCVVEAIAVALG
jgi:hypothetical protein